MKTPTTMIPSASTIQRDIGPHQRASGSARVEPSRTKQRTSPKFEGLRKWWPRKRIRCFESSATAAVPAKIHHPFMLHQSPCSVPGTRSTNAIPFPVRRALAGHMITRRRWNVMPSSSTAHVSSETRIWAIESWKPNAVWPMTWSEVMTAATRSLGSRIFGSRTGYAVPRIVSDAPCRRGQPGSMRSWGPSYRRPGPVQARFSGSRIDLLPECVAARRRCFSL